MQEYLPWMIIAVQFCAHSYIILRLIRVLDDNTIAKTGMLAPSIIPPVPAKTISPVVIPPKLSPITSSSDLVIDDGLVNFIKATEAFSGKAYWDYKQWSIGYGTKATSPTEIISQTEAEARLKTEIGLADKSIASKFPNLPKGVHQALIDLTYNAGPGWEEQSLGHAVSMQKWDTVKADILQYNHAGGQVNAGLTKRREAEVSWFDKPL